MINGIRLVESENHDDFVGELYDVIQKMGEVEIQYQLQLKRSGTRVYTALVISYADKKRKRRTSNFT